ncbi:MAG: NAD(P)-dependent oxidoreductase [Beutenbergiaceae bacterium]
MTDPERIGFIGLGVMGWPMAQNVRRRFANITVYDIVTARRDMAAAAGFDTADSLGDLVDRSDIIVSVLPDTPDVEAIVNSPGGVHQARPGTCLIEMSTISPTVAAELGTALETKGVAMVDAPVSGGVQKAESGQLSIMVGGSEGTIERVRSVLETMGTPVHMGDVGAGQATKACNQVAVTLTIQAACEAFALGANLGVDLGKLRSALLGGSCASWILENMGETILQGDDRPGFRIELQVKDLRIAQETAQAASTPLPGLATVLGLYTEAMANGFGGAGNQSLARVYERHTGAAIGKQKFQPEAFGSKKDADKRDTHAT